MSSSSGNSTTSSTSSSSETTKLLLTAVGAAVTGAALSILTMHYSDRRRERKEEQQKQKQQQQQIQQQQQKQSVDQYQQHQRTPSIVLRGNDSTSDAVSFLYDQDPLVHVGVNLASNAEQQDGSAAVVVGDTAAGGGGGTTATTSAATGEGTSGDGQMVRRGSFTILFPHNHEERMRRRIAARAVVEEDNFQPRQSVTVRVPASSANLGPGYDTIGIAVDLWSEITIERSDKFEITAEGEGAIEMPKDESNYMVVGCKAAFETANKPLPTLKYHVISRIPYARGLGSSSAAIVAGIIGGLVLAGHRLPCWGSEALLQIAAGIEGHPDNVAPVIYGGVQIGLHDGSRWVTERVPCPAGLQLVMFIPNFIGKTSDARNVLSTTVSRDDAAFNISRTAFLVHALCMGNLDNLKHGVQDKLHQPQRGSKLYKFLYPMIAAAENAGASCSFLSGAGPTVMAFTSGASGDIFAQREKERSDLAVAKAMIQAAKEYNIEGKLVVTNAANEGARVVKVDPPFSTGIITYRDNI